jgi:hypothetical protein
MLPQGRKNPLISPTIAVIGLIADPTAINNYHREKAKK